MIFRTNCRFWVGEKPCRMNRLCDGCEAFERLGERILIIKLGAPGDVLRTTPLLAGLRKKHPQAHITWITRQDSRALLETHPELNRLLALDHESLLVLSEQTFEALYCLDKEPVALALANRIKCPAKYGWGLAQDGVGTPGALQASAEYALALGVSDELKFFKNTKTYPEIIFEMAELDYRGEPYELRITPEDAAFPANFWGGEWPEVKEKVLVLVTGCGPKFPKKRWTESGFARLADWARENLGARVLLLAGPGEEGLNQSILAQCAHAHRDSRAQHSVRQAAALLAQSRLVVTGDTLALHLALAMGRKTIALFGPTCPAEIDLYGLGEKIVSKAPCAPCYRQCCSQSPDCMQSIALEEVRDAVRRLWS